MEVHDNDDMLHDYVFKWLSSADNRKVSRHLERCDECRGKVEEFRKVNAGSAERFLSDILEASLTTCDDMRSLMKRKVEFARKGTFLPPDEERLIYLHRDVKKCRRCGREYDKLVEAQFDIDEQRATAKGTKPTMEVGTSITCKPHGMTSNRHVVTARTGKMREGMKILPPPVGVKGFTSLSSLSIGLKGDAVPSAKTRKKTNKTGNKTLSPKKK